MTAVSAAELEAAQYLLGSISPGRILYGFCNGFFGRDSWNDKVIVASGIERGEAWIVAREASFLDSDLVFASGIPLELPSEWGIEPSTDIDA